jgi:NAD(P)-dependent dehydrogenase (short-subunit alcohol dehydrogenase family)
MEQLRGRNALVTGSSSGIGRHIAQALAREGMNVVACGRSPDALERAVAELRALGVRAEAVAVELADAAQVEGLIERATAALGPLDVLVNNAGVELASSFTRHSREELISIIDINLTAPILLTRQVLPGMLERGRGHVVFTSSVAGKVPPAYQAAYAASKAGLIDSEQIAAHGVSRRPGRVLSRLPGIHRRRRHVSANARAGLEVEPDRGRDHGRSCCRDGGQRDQARSPRGDRERISSRSDRGIVRDRPAPGGAHAAEGRCQRPVPPACRLARARLSRRPRVDVETHTAGCPNPANDQCEVPVRRLAEQQQHPRGRPAGNV